MEPVWERLRHKLFLQWATSEPAFWPHIKAKLDLISDLQEELRKMANKRDIDNA